MYNIKKNSVISPTVKTTHEVQLKMSNNFERIRTF